MEQAAVRTVRDYLNAMEARDLDLAQSFLGDGFVMVFPGNARFRHLKELVGWSRDRYKFVRKKYETFDVAAGRGGVTVVYCTGTLSGEWLDGSSFSGIRFIDRFELEDDRIVNQQVWNDMAEAMRKR